MNANHIAESHALRPRALLAILLALALARGLSALLPAGASWGVGQARDVHPLVVAGVTLAALAALAWASFSRAPAGEARWWVARGWPWALALALGGLLVALPDRVRFVGDFLLRFGILESATGFETIFPQALPLDALLNHTIPVRVAAALGVTPFAVLRAMGVLEAFVLVALAVRFARLVTRSEAAAAAVAIVIALGGYATFLTGYPKPTTQVALAVVATATLGFELVTRGRGAGGFALAVSLGLLLHRGALPLVLPWLVATAFHVRDIVRETRAQPDARPTALTRALPLLVPIIVLTILARPLAERIIGFDAGVNFLPAEVRAQGGVLAAAFATTRLLDDVNAVWFHAPLAPLALVAVALAWRRRDAAYLASVMLAFLPILLFVHLPLGPFRDVDALGGFGAAVAVASAWAVARWLEPDGARRVTARGAAMAVALSVAVPFVLALVAATDLERGFTRAEAIVHGPPARSATQRASVLDWMGLRALNESRYDVARRAFARLCAETPIPHALELWGAAALLDGEPAEARSAFGLLVERAPAEPVGWFGLWMSAAATGDTLTASRASAHALQWGPESPEMRKVVEFFEHYPLLYGVLRGVVGAGETDPGAGEARPERIPGAREASPGARRAGLAARDTVRGPRDTLPGARDTTPR